MTRRAGADAEASSAASWAMGSRSTGAQFERLGLVESGEFEQVLDEAAHPDRLALDAIHRLRDVVGVLSAPIR